MEGDSDQLVLKCAAMLTSDDPELIAEHVDLLLQDLAKGKEGMEKIARAVQEIAAYGGGEVLNVLWMGTLGNHPSSITSWETGCKYFMSCTIAFQIFTSSKVVVERYLLTIGADEKGSAQTVYEIFSARALESARSLSLGEQILFESMIVRPLECLANFARGSKVFRDVIKAALEEQTIFEVFGSFLSAKFLCKISAEENWEVRVALDSLVESLALSTDSQLWALDKGLLKLMSAIYKHSPLRGLKNKLKSDYKHNAFPVVRCTAVLIYLLEAESALQKLRAHNALSGFKPHSRTINAASVDCFRPHGLQSDPATRRQGRYWSYIEAKLQGVPVNLAIGNVRLHVGQLGKFVRGRMGGIDIPVVCSWKLCTAGSEPVLGQRFGKCGACQVARYCR